MNKPSIARHRQSRRGFLTTVGAVGAGLAIAGTGTAVVEAQSGAAGDLATARVAASLEVLAVGAYKATLEAATGGKLGAVPPAVATYVQTAMSHHQFALEKWNGIITGAGSPAVAAPPADLNATVQAAFGQVKDVKGAAELALLLEQTAADTYFKAIPTLTIPAAIDLAGNLQIIDQQHASILLFVLGRYPVPDTFQSGAKAYTPPRAAAAAPAAAAPAAAPAPMPMPAPAAQPARPTAMPQTGDSGLAADGRIYTVQAGDTLTSISQVSYGSDAYVDRIWADNLDIVSRPEELQPGMVLTLPAIGE